MRDLTKRLCRPGCDLQKEQAIQEAIIEIRELRAEVQTWKQQSESYWEKIKAMEKQEPAGTLHDDGYFVWNPRCRPDSNYVGWKTKLYTLPGAKEGEPAQPAPSIPEGWLRAIDEALIVAHIGMASASDTYEQAKAKLENLIGFHVDVATDPAVNGSWKLVPIEPTIEMLDAGEDTFVPTYTGTPVSAPIDVYRAMIAAARRPNHDSTYGHQRQDARHSP